MAERIKRFVTRRTSRENDWAQYIEPPKEMFEAVKAAVEFDILREAADLVECLERQVINGLRAVEKNEKDLTLEEEFNKEHPWFMTELLNDQDEKLTVIDLLRVSSNPAIMGFQDDLRRLSFKLNTEDGLQVIKKIDLIFVPYTRMPANIFYALILKNHYVIVCLLCSLTPHLRITTNFEN